MKAKRFRRKKMKTRLTHTRANVSDLYRSIEWYEKTLGFKCYGADITDTYEYAQFEYGEGAAFSIMKRDWTCSGRLYGGLIWISVKK